MLSIQGLEAGYGKLHILYGVNLALHDTEIAVLIGPNGAGKSTVLKSLFHLTTVYSGKILFKNKDITHIPAHQLIELGISYVPQGRQVFPSLTVQENLEMGAYLTREKELIRMKMKEVFTHFPELKQKLQEYAYSLSGGQQQMVAIGRALMQDPQLLLMDEPSAGLSPQMVKLIFQKIKEINSEGTAVLIVEQNAKQACSIADKVFLLEDGKIVLHGDKKILQNPRIKHVYLGGR